MILTEEDLLGEEESQATEPFHPPAISNHDSPLLSNNFDTTHVPIRQDLKEIDGPLNKNTLKQELDNYDLYLHNIHNAFSMATNVSSLLRLTDGALRINKQRRATIEHALNLKTTKNALPQFDAMGNVIK